MYVYIYIYNIIHTGMGRGGSRFDAPGSGKFEAAATVASPSGGAGSAGKEGAGAQFTCVLLVQKYK